MDWICYDTLIKLGSAQLMNKIVSSAEPIVIQWKQIKATCENLLT